MSGEKASGVRKKVSSGVAEWLARASLSLARKSSLTKCTHISKVDRKVVLISGNLVGNENKPIFSDEKGDMKTN